MRSLPYLLAVSLFVAPLSSAQSTPPSTAIAHVNVIPMNSETVLHDQTVLITGGTIAKIAPASQVKIPRDTHVVDGNGLYLLPGLIDSHVHFYSRQQPQLYVANGVTTVFNLNGKPLHLVWRESVASGKLLGPRIYTVAPKFDRAHTPDEGVALVDDYARQGYDGIKIYNQVSKAEYPALVAAAKRHHMLVVGHIAREPGFQDTLDAGQAIAHAEEYLYTFFQAEDNRPPDPKLIPQAVALTKASGVPVISTLVTYEHILELASNSAAFFARPENRYWAPWELEDMKDPSQDFYLTFGSDEVAELHRNYPFLKTLVGALNHASVPILAGTDSGWVQSVPGLALHEELGDLVQAGLTPFEALESATIVPARFLRGDREFGTIEEGKVADLVLVRANPLENIANTKQIAGVCLRGRWFPKSDLDRMLEDLRTSYANDQRTAEDAFARNPQQAVTFLNSIDPFFELGSFVVRQAALANGVGKFEKSIQDATKSNPQSPLNSPDLMNDVADFLLAKHRNDDAIALFQFNTTQHPASAIAYDRLGRAYRSLGQYGPALQAYQKALAVDPGYWNADSAKRRIAELTKKVGESKN